MVERFTFLLKRIQRWRSSFCIRLAECLDEFAKVSADLVDGAFLGDAHPVLDHGEGLLDGIEVRRVRRQVPKPGSGGPEGAADL
jgi:hypothetical protein